MQDSKKSHTEDDPVESNFLDKIKNVAIGILIVATILSIILLIGENTLPTEGRGYDLTKIGAWGDTVGGVLNPIFSFLALLGLLWTIRLQSKELALSRKELVLSREELKGSREANEKLASAADQQNIENAFFQLFNLLQENLQTIRVHPSSLNDLQADTRIYIGAKAFEAYHNSIVSSLSTAISETPEQGSHFGESDDTQRIGWSEILKEYPDELTAKREKLIESFEWVYKQHQADLGRYFRLLFNVLRFLSEKRSMLPATMYETYFKIVRAALSNYELTLIMANCLTPNGADMKKYVSEFQLFDNLSRDLLTVRVCDTYMNHITDVDFLDLWVEFDERSFGENLNNFKS